MDAILSDVVMPGMDGLEFLARLREQAPGVPVVLMSGQATVEIAVKATRLGALDFVEKPVSLDRLLLTLRNALRTSTGSSARTASSGATGRTSSRSSGRARPWPPCAPSSRRPLPPDVPILILGENGTGKELVARAVHELSPRAERPFVRMNCAAVPAELVESELFGHEKGAFTGAAVQRKGPLRAGGRGHALPRRDRRHGPRPCRPRSCASSRTASSTRVGGAAEIKVDVRLISATNRDLEALLAEGRFREDLLLPDQHPDPPDARPARAALRRARPRRPLRGRRPAGATAGSRAASRPTPSSS